jgi:hypothetical protein
MAWWTEIKTPYNSTYKQAGFLCLVGQGSVIFEVQCFGRSSMVKIPACL